MSNCITFHTQIASIMEVLANAAVAEICKLVEDGYAVLRLEISQSQKEKEALRRKLQMLELRAARGCADSARTPAGSAERARRGRVLHRLPGTAKAGLASQPTGESIFEKHMDIDHISDGVPAAGHEEDSKVSQNSCADMEEGRTESLLIKEERLEEDSDPQGELKIREERVEELGAEDDRRTAVVSKQTPSTNGREELADQQRIQQCVLEPADLEERKPDSVLIKEERLKDDRASSDPQEGLRTYGEGAVESRAGGGERTPIQDTQNKAAQHAEELTEQHRTRHSAWESASMEQERAESCLIKEETPEGDLRKSDPEGHQPNREDGAVESRAGGGERTPIQDTQNKAAQHTEEPSAWEVSGMKAVFVREVKKRSVNPRERREERRAGGLTDLHPERAVYERPGQLRAYFARESTDAETEDLPRWYAAEMDSESLLVHPDLKSVPAAEEGAGNSGSTSGSLAWQPEIVMIDSVPIKVEAEVTSVWSSKAVTGVDHTQPRNHKDGDREEAQPENVISMCPPYAPMAVRQKAAQSKSSAANMKSFAFSKHLRTSHGVGMRVNQLFCKSLGEGISHPKDIELQQGIHTGEKPFSCPQCGKLFAHPGRLKVHQRVHTGEKPFSCMLCGKRFAQSSHIKRHQRVHTGEKPFSCTQCGKSFSHLCNLKTHQTVHTGERPYGCTQCGKNFSSLGNLIRHQSVHIGK